VPAAPIYTRWIGFYAGGQWGYGGAQYDFGGATQSLYTFMLRELALEAQQHLSTWKVLGKADKSGYIARGFVGFNTQWDEVILGFDVHYNRSNLFASAPATRSAAARRLAALRRLSWQRRHTHSRLGRRASARRLWVQHPALRHVRNSVGRADISCTATVDGEENPATPPATCAATPTCVPFSFSSSQSKQNTWIYGWAAGPSADFLILPNLFLRAEYEYSPSPPSTASRPASIRPALALP
jgi:outer membrane immunogenic protein